MNDPDRDKKRKSFDQFIRYSSLAFEMMAIMALGTYAGYRLDKWLSLSFPAFTLGLLILSVIGAVFYAVRKFLN